MGLPVLLKFLLDLSCLLVSIHILEVSTLFGDRFAFEVTITIGPILGLEALGAILGVHGVNEPGLLVVAKIRKCSDV